MTPVTMTTVTITIDRRGVAVVTLSRPDKHNALSAAMISDLTDAAAMLGDDPKVRAVILTAAGESFCAGGDLGWMRDQMAADGPARAREATRLAMMLQALNTCPKPVIGRVQGNAFGGGIGLMSVCDTVVASRSARFGLTETRLGLIPATIGPYVVARMGEAAARRVFMSARLFGAEEAQNLGLVATLAEPETLDAAVEAEVVPYLSCAPGAVAAAKALVRRLGPPIDAGIIAETIAALTSRWESPEASEGIAAFFEKRPPEWKR